MYCSNVWLVHSVFLSPSGWYPEVKWSFILRAFPRDLKNCDTNSVPQSEVMCDGTLCFEKTWSTKSWASCMKVMISYVRMKIACLYSWSTTTKIAVKPNEGGNYSMKSIDIVFPELEVVGGYGRCWVLWIRFATGKPRVGFFHTVPKPSDTAPV